MASGIQRPRHTSRPHAQAREDVAPLAPDADAEIALGMAGTAMPFAASVYAEAECWLRILRLYGDAGVALQGLGVSEAPLEALDRDEKGEPTDAARASRSVIETVTEHAVHAAARRGAHTIATSDVLVAVAQVYGADFEGVLWAHGTDLDEVLERLGLTTHEDSPDG